jgi:hypothetical protein
VTFLKLTGLGVCLAIVVSLTSCSGGGQPAGQPSSTAAAPTSITTTTTTTPTRSGAPDPGLGGDDGQIRTVIQALQDGYNTSNWAAFKAQLCAPLADQFTDASLQQQRDRDGLLTITVGTMSLKTETAMAVVTPKLEHGTGSGLTKGDSAAHVIIYRLQRGSDGWKICSYV